MLCILWQLKTYPFKWNGNKDVRTLYRPEKIRGIYLRNLYRVYWKLSTGLVKRTDDLSNEHKEARNFYRTDEVHSVFFDNIINTISEWKQDLKKPLQSV